MRTITHRGHVLTITDDGDGMTTVERNGEELGTIFDRRGTGHAWQVETTHGERDTLPTFRAAVHALDDMFPETVERYNREDI